MLAKWFLGKGLIHNQNILRCSKHNLVKITLESWIQLKILYAPRQIPQASIAIVIRELGISAANFSTASFVTGKECSLRGLLSLKCLCGNKHSIIYSGKRVLLPSQCKRLRFAPSKHEITHKPLLDLRGHGAEPHNFHERLFYNEKRFMLSVIFYL